MSFRGKRTKAEKEPASVEAADDDQEDTNENMDGAEEAAQSQPSLQLGEGNLNCMDVHDAD